MRIRRKTLWGRIDKGGVLQFPLTELEDFCRNHPDKSCTIRVEIMPKEASEKLTNYYYGYIVEAMQSALYDIGESKTKEETDLFIRTICPVCREEKIEKGQWKSRVKDWEELDIAECIELIDFIKRYAAENLYLILSDPE